MLNTFEETFEVTEMCTFKHEPFFIVGGGGGGAYSWYFTVLDTNCTVAICPNPLCVALSHTTRNLLP